MFSKLLKDINLKSLIILILLIIILGIGCAGIKIYNDKIKDYNIDVKMINARINSYGYILYIIQSNLQLYRTLNEKDKPRVKQKFIDYIERKNNTLKMIYKEKAYSSTEFYFIISSLN